jgi:serine protease
MINVKDVVPYVNNERPVRRVRGGGTIRGVAFLFLVILLIIPLILTGCGNGSPAVPNSISGKLSVLLTGASEPGGANGELRAYRILRSGSAVAATTASAGDDFVPGQIIVRYREGYSSLQAARTAQTGGFKVMKSRSGPGQGTRMVLQLDQAGSGALKTKRVRERTLQEIDYLNTLPHVEYAQPNFIYRSTYTPDDDLYAGSGLPSAGYRTQWHFPLIKMDHVWEEWDTMSSGLVDDVSSVIVAVIDTGIARSTGNKVTGLDHVDMEGIFVSEYDFVSSSTMAWDGDGIDDDATDVGDWGPLNDHPVNSTFHGTHVAGTIGAVTDNTTGVASVAGGRGEGMGVRIMPLRVLGRNGGTTVDIREAVLYAAGLPNASPITLGDSQKADVINMSLGSTSAGGDTDLKNAVSEAYAEGVVIVASAGNYGTMEPFYPAAFPNVISVSAVDISAQLAGYSSFGSTVDITAPGGSFSFDLNEDAQLDSVRSTMASYNGTNDYTVDEYSYLAGTSMAAPHVAAVAALMKAADDTLSPYDIESILKDTAIDIGETGRDDLYGAGLVNAYEAVMEALNSPTQPVMFPFAEGTNTKRVLMSGLTPESSFTLSNIVNSEPIAIDTITKANGSIWLKGDIDTFAGGIANPNLTIDLSIDTSFPGLTDGSTHTETLEITWSDGARTGSEFVYVLYNVDGFAPNLSQIGDVYVAALDTHSSSDFLEYFDVTNLSDNFSYTILNVPAGDYVIGASTDLDGDGVIFGDTDQEEIVGFYPDSYLPEIIGFSSGDILENIDFVISDAY